MKKIELTHDILAEEVFKNSSGLQRMRREAENRIKKRYSDFQENGIPVAEDELYNLIIPYLGIVNINDEERSFVIEMERRIASDLNRKKIKKRNLIIGLSATSIVFIFLFLTTIYLWGLSAENEQKNRALNYVNLASVALNDGFPSLAYRLAEKARNTSDDSIVQKNFNSILQEVGSLPLVNEIHVGDSLIDFGFIEETGEIFSIHKNGTIKFWNFDGGRSRKDEISGYIKLYRKSSENKFFALVDEKDTLRLYDNIKGKLVFKENFDSEIQGLDFSSDDQNVLVFFENKKIQVWDIEGGSLVQELIIEMDYSLAKFIKSDIQDSDLVLCLSDTNAEVFDLENNLIVSFNNLLKEFNIEGINGVDLSFNDSLAIFHSPYGDKIFDMHGFHARDIVSLDFNNGTYVKAQFLNKDRLGRMIGLRPDMQEYTIWNFGLKRVDFQHLISPNTLLWVGASPDLTWILSCSSDNYLIVLQESKNSSPLKVSYDDFLKVKCRITNASFSNEDNIFLSNNGNQFIKIWDLNLYNRNETDLANRQKISSKLRDFSDEERSLYRIDQ